MIVTRRIRDDLFEASAPLEGITCSAGSPDVALDELRATLSLKTFAAHRMRVIKRATKIAYDPQEGCYVADCPAVGIVAKGFTRQDAWDKFLYGLKLADQARAAAATEDLTDPEAIDASPEDIPNAEVS